LILSNVNLKTADKETAFDITEMLLDDGVVVFPNQDLSPDEEVQFCQLIGNCQRLQNEPGERGEHIAVNDHIIRVTGEKNNHGEPGLFGHTSALDWHANQASSYDRAPLIWLYGVKGSEGSCTSWIDMQAAYRDLPQIIKTELKEVEITLGYKSGSYSDSEFFVEHHATDRPFKLVHTNDGGKTGLYFPFLQIFGMVGYKEHDFKQTMDWLIEHVQQDKYRYDHHWKDGDVVISEQWLTIHKRHEFDNMSNRVLHRIAFDYEQFKYERHR
jgi:taurine dioxygenase